MVHHMVAGPVCHRSHDARVSKVHVQSQEKF